MPESFSIGDPPICVAIRRSSQARRVVLSMGRTGRAPVVTAPHSVPAARVQAFLREHEGWLRGELARAPALTAVGDGVRLPFCGRDVTVVHRPHGTTAVEGDRLIVGGAPAGVPTKVAAFLKEAARLACVAASDDYAVKLGRKIGKVTMRDPRGRWGSCSWRGDLMFSWRLILAPPSVLEYVVAHEVAHLAELNHSDRFWRVVHDLYGEFDAQRSWLRTHGRRLMSYDFSASKAVAAW